MCIDEWCNCFCICFEFVLNYVEFIDIVLFKLFTIVMLLDDEWMCEIIEWDLLKWKKIFVENLLL